MQVRAASVLFVDNPVGTGYSYTDTEDALTKDVAMVASDMMVLLKSFFSLKTEFQVSKKIITTRLNSIYVQHLCYSIWLFSPTEYSLLYIFWVLWRQNGSSYFPRTLKGTEIIVLTLGFMWEFCSNTHNTKKSHVLADSIKTWKSHNISYFCKSNSGMWLKY